MSNSTSTEIASKERGLTFIIYILYGIAVFTVIPAFIAIIINLVKKQDVVGTYLESHFKWQINTFLTWFILAVIGWMTAIFLIGFVILLFNWIWFIYRIIKGLLRLSENKEI